MTDAENARSRAPRLSVLMSTYNAQPFLKAALDSILRQSFRDFELLVIDDGSSDDSLDLLNAYAKQDARLSVRGRENRGLAHTLNELATMARGEYLARMDADDECLPNRFAQQLAHLDANPDIGALGGDAIIIDEQGREIFTSSTPREHDAIDHSNIRGRVAMIHPAVTMRRSAFESAGGYCVDFQRAQDLDLWLRMAERTKLANLPTPLIRYRLVATGMSGGQTAMQEKMVHMACARACARRGIGDMPFEYARWRPDSDKASQIAFMRKYAWQAWGAGNRATARHYGWRALRTAPFSAESWRIMAALLTRTPAPPRDRESA